ncbi:hypothetical protein SISSUDRAFT_1116753 [Sistotremastrum suecicum HHB10207 ss-3]|uniref:Phosphatases II n=1 Tax=Sistotremastrum suecicum HHB10207 ss-3 TaxID=1314776 RepID=A0A166HII9_9AGAM|nr:hypothetical protein SISSUDRAFT_1116753 [Sistotremastrum suecicum HHB10207 ss-3]
MDFFSTPANAHPSVSAVDDPNDPFARAIGRRYSQENRPLLTARLSPIASPELEPTLEPNVSAAPLAGLSLSPRTPRPQAPSNLSSPPPSTFSAVSVSMLPELLARSHTMLLDLRPPNSFSSSRISRALSLSVPSTLLKRPGFPLAKLTTMLPTQGTRARFSQWRAAARIIVYDVDSKPESGLLPERSNILGLLRKFVNEGYEGELLWLNGGFATALRASQSGNSELASLISFDPPSESNSDDESAPSARVSSHPADSPLRAAQLPLAAFQQASTTAASHRPNPSPSNFRPSSLSQSASHPSPFTEGAALAPSFDRPVAANPFYDNIRQLTELSQGITEHIPLELPPTVRARSHELPFAWLRRIAQKDADEEMEALAMQFYRIELAEQRRLVGVMDHHSSEGTVSHMENQTVPFPFSITAGIEKGTKNRYRNIWPFEHARLRLQTPSLHDGSDYINASIVQPLGTRKRYIATQGPLTDTFSDFWSAVWEQNVRVIVMLTQVVEGSSVKCGTYWPTKREPIKTFGPLRVELIYSEHIPEHEDMPNTDFFAIPKSGTSKAQEHAARRVFRLSHLDHASQAREISHLQYLGWPDFNVPESPRGLLTLIKDVDAIYDRLTSEGIESGPTLLHCSAGVGRTGGYIIVDAILDALRREMAWTRAHHKPSQETESSSDSMDVSMDDQSSLPNPVPNTSSQLDDVMTASDDSSPMEGLTLQSSDDRSYPISPPPQVFGQPSEYLRSRLNSTEARPTINPHPKVPGDSSTTVKNDSNSSNSTQKGGRLLTPPSFVSNSMSSLTARSSSPSSASFPSSQHQSALSLGLDAETDATSMSARPPRESLSPSPGSASQESLLKSSVRQSKPTLGTTFDYTDPRSVDNKQQSNKQGSSSPVRLSTLTEPVQQVLEDMREQRMSLCQSLRQYVFVHRAVIEGALELVDEEVLRYGPRSDSSSSKQHGPSASSEGQSKLARRPKSMKRRQRSDSLLEERRSQTLRTEGS